MWVPELQKNPRPNLLFEQKETKHNQTKTKHKKTKQQQQPTIWPQTNVLALEKFGEKFRGSVCYYYYSPLEFNQENGCSGAPKLHYNHKLEAPSHTSIPPLPRSPHICWCYKCFSKSELSVKLGRWQEAARNHQWSVPTFNLAIGWCQSMMMVMKAGQQEEQETSRQPLKDSYMLNFCSPNGRHHHRSAPKQRQQHHRRSCSSQHSKTAP